MQFFVLGVFIWGCGIWGPMYYLSVYVYGLVGIFPVLVRVRTVVQHFDPSIQTLSTVSPRFISRSTVATMTESMVVGARMDYHFEHHLYPNLPYYGLKQMHRALLASGFFDLDRPMAGRIFHTNDYLRTYFKLSGLGT